MKKDEQVIELADKKLREQGLHTESLNRLDALNQLGNEVKFNAPTNVLTEAQVHVEMDAQRSKLKEAIKEIKVDGIGQIKVDKDFQILDNNGNELSREQKKNVLKELTKKMGSITPDLAKMWIQNTIVRQDPVFKDGKQIAGPIPHTAQIGDITFKITNNKSNSAEMLATTNGKIWETTYNALKKVGATDIWINHTNYKHEFLGKGHTHGSGSAFDINSITVNGKEIAMYNMNGKSMEYPKILRNFDTAFMNQIGVQKCWTPHTVYSGPGNTPRENMTKEWLKTAMTRPDWTTMTDKQKSAAFREYLEKLKDSNDKRIYTDDQIKDLMVSEFGHIDHNHYDVNTHYSDYREWK